MSGAQKIVLRSIAPFGGGLLPMPPVFRQAPFHIRECLGQVSQLKSNGFESARASGRAGRIPNVACNWLSPGACEGADPKAAVGGEPSFICSIIDRRAGDAAKKVHNGIRLDHD